MKRIIIFLLIFVLVFSYAREVGNPPQISAKAIDSHDSGISASSISENGDNRNSIAYFKRTFASKQIGILNSYLNTTDHSTTLDLKQYQVGGWTLTNARIDISSLNAAVEREVVGKNYENLDFSIQYVDIISTFFSGLAQGFYNQGHDGVLVNYSIYYLTNSYNPSLRGNASFVIVSDSDLTDATPPTDITDPVNMTQSNDIFSWETISAQNASLSADTTYWAIIDGSNLYQGGSPARYPNIYWPAENAAGAFASYQRGTASWDLRTLEALMNYTYIPWNQTSGSPLGYNSPKQIALMANSSDVSSMTFECFSSNQNLNSIVFETNQSVYMTYNLTLTYTKEIVAQSVWRVDSSGGIVRWNTSIPITYPELTGTISKFLNISIAAGWTVVGLYNSSLPSINFGNYIVSQLIASCSNMNNEIWTLCSTSFNCLTDAGFYDSLDDSVLGKTINIQTNVDINLTLKEEDNDIISTGSTNLTIHNSDSTIWAPSNISVTAGKSYYLWDIDSTTSSNGAYTIEMYWTNGTQAGYLTKTIVVFFSTSLTPASSHIDAFTESSFSISVDFDELFTPRGLTDAEANLVYSFDSGTNTSLSYQGAGTWSATVSTSGKDPGSHSVVIYAEGYAVENQSISIDITLIHDTEPLTVSWSNTNNISYVQTTELSIGYYRVGGSPIPTASVNVSIGGQIWQLPYDSGSETFKITFNGTDAYPGFGNFSLSIEAGLDGYESQSDYSQKITIYREPTKFAMDLSNGRNITYLENTTLTVRYTMLNDMSVENAWVNITINGRTLRLHENITDGTYYIRFNGSDPVLGFGTFNFSISAWKYGYVANASTGQTLTLREVPTIFEATWIGSSSITYVESTTLSVNYTMIDGTAVKLAEVWVTISDESWLLAWDAGTETYRRVFNGNDPFPGFGFYNPIINASKTGYQNHTTTLTLFIDIEPTSLEIELLPSYSMNYTDYTIIFIDYLMNDTSPVADGNVTVTIGGDARKAIWNGARYELRVNGNDTFLGFGINYLTINASNYGFADASATGPDYNITLFQEPTSLTIQWSNGNDPSYFDHTVLIVGYAFKGGFPVVNASVNVTIGTHTWNLVWNASSGNYQMRFNGSDSIPGVGTHPLIIIASKYGFMQRSNLTEVLILPDIPTTLLVEWSNGSTITFVQNTTLLVKYRMYNESLITTAQIKVTIGTKTWNLNWSDGSQAYELLISGSDNPPGFGVHQVFIDASLTNFDPKSSSSNYLTVNREPTDIVITWSNGNSLSYYGYTFLIVEYTYNEGLPVVNAKINVTIDTHTWDLVWNKSAKYYQLKFNGSDSLPGVGNHSLVIKAGKFGFINQYNDTETITLPIIPTNLVIEWTQGNDISYVQNTTIRAIFEMDINNTPVSGATLSFTIDSIYYTLEWNSDTYAYEYTFLGDDPLPGFGNHSLVIQAVKTDFVSQIDASQSITIYPEITSIDINWTNGLDIGYHSSTTLSVAYQMSNGATIVAAMVNATIGGYFWNLTFNPTIERYELTINGSDTPPGFGIHNITVNAWKYGYVAQSNSTFEINLHPEETSFEFLWEPSDSINYFEETTLSIFYLMSNDLFIEDATVTLQIDSIVWNAVWNNDTHAYEVTFYGSDDRLSFDNHTCLIEASKSNYYTLSNSSQILEKYELPTEIQITWSNGNTITYSNSTNLYIEYTMTNTTPIMSAWVQVISGSHIWNLTWNSNLMCYNLTFNEEEAWPGLGVHVLEISCNRMGFVAIENKSEILTIQGELGSINSYWIEDGIITYIQSDTLVVNYTIADGSPIAEATVNVTIDGHLWNLTWYPESQTYRIMFNGTDDPPGLGFNRLEIRAWRLGYDGVLDNSLFLNIIEDQTTISVLWSNSNNITYFNHTYLFVRYFMSNGSDIHGASVNVTITGTTWVLVWNESQKAYGVLFNGWDNPPSLGKHNLIINATKHGFAYEETLNYTLTLLKDPTTLQISWTDGNIITYVESTTLVVYYRMSNGTPIQTGTVIATIGTDFWILNWNNSIGAYYTTFKADIDLSELVTFSVQIEASGDIFATSSTMESLTIIEESTYAIASWTFASLDWTNNVTLLIDYKDTHGSLITGATQKTISINQSIYTLHGTNGSYWMVFNNTFDLGHHLVLANISKYGYKFAVNASITFDIVEAATNLNFVWSPLNLTIQYTDELNLTVDYTYSGGNVPDTALVNVTIGGRFYELHYSSGAWRISIPGSDLGIGIFDADISAWLYGYEARIVMTTEINITLAANSFIVKWEPASLTAIYTDRVNLTVTYLEDFLPIIGADVHLFINESMYNLTYSVIDKKWHMSIDALDIDLGAWNVTVKANKTGYTEGYYNNILTVIQAPTYLEIQNSRDTIYYDETSILNIYYKMTNLSFVPDAMISLTLDDIEQSRTWIVDHWNSVINGTILGVGIYNYTIIASAHGFETQVDTLQIAVLNIPTAIHSDPTIITSAREFISFRFSYIDNRTGNSIPATEFFVVWSDFYNLVTLPNYTYIVTVGGSDFHIGNYTFQITLGKLGYNNSVGSIDINVHPIPTQFANDSSYFQYENETLQIDLQLLNAAHLTPIDWAQVVVELEEVDYVAVYNNTNKMYEITLKLMQNMAPGTYTLHLHAEAEDCNTADVDAILEVLPKSLYSITLNVADQVQAENDLTISISVTGNNRPVEDLNIQINIIVHYGNGSQQSILIDVITDSHGVALFVFEIPNNAVELDVTATFQGSISEWPAESPTKSVNIIRGGTSGLGPIISNPVTLSIIAGGISLPLLALVYRRRRKVGERMLAPISNAAVTPMPPRTAVSGLQQKLIEEIINSEEGITRAELSRRLGLSASKIGSMVKDLLNSDLGVYEVKEGVKKLIKFRKLDY